MNSQWYAESNRHIDDARQKLERLKLAKKTKETYGTSSAEALSLESETLSAQSLMQSLIMERLQSIRRDADRYLASSKLTAAREELSCIIAQAHMYSSPYSYDASDDFKKELARMAYEATIRRADAAKELLLQIKIRKVTVNFLTLFDEMLAARIQAENRNVQIVARATIDILTEIGMLSGHDDKNKTQELIWEIIKTIVAAITTSGALHLFGLLHPTAASDGTRIIKEESRLASEALITRAVPYFEEPFNVRDELFKLMFEIASKGRNPLNMLWRHGLESE
jgi:hypothetical protein